jgi:hypothetical protein
MGTSFNNQWVLGRAASRRGEPIPDSSGEEGQPRADAHRAGDPHRLPANARSGHGAAALGLVITRRRVRKHPRWIDRDT